MADATGAGGMSSLFQNPLFLEFLGNAGQSISAGQGAAPGLNQTVQRQIQSANTMKMLQSMLGTEGKLNMGGDGSLNIKSNLSDIEKVFSDRRSDIGGNYGSEVAMNAPGAESGNDSMLGGLLGNPQPGYLSNPDLAGLTGQDIMGIFAGAEGVRRHQDEMGLLQQRITALAMGKQDGLDTGFPIQVPGVGAVTTREWNALPPEMQRYAVYAHGAKLSGVEGIPDLMTFRSMEPTEQGKYIEMLKQDPEAKEVAKYISGPTPGEMGQREESKAEVEARGYIKSSDFVKDVGKLIDDNSRKIRSADDPEKVKRSLIFNRVSEVINAGRGNQYQQAELAEDGKTMVLFIEWPDGTRDKVQVGL